MNKFLKRIEELKKISKKEKIIFRKQKLENLLMESLAYDWELNKEEIRSIRAREKTIQEKYILNDLNKLQIDLYSVFDNLKKEASKEVDKFNSYVLVIVLINNILNNWWNIFWIWSKKIKIDIDMWLDSSEWILNIIIKLSYLILKEEPFLRYNHTKWLLLTNYLLKTINLPEIKFYHKDKKRFLRSMDHYIDYKKEFYLSIISELNKNIFNEISPQKIISLNELRKRKNIKNPYIKPGERWYGIDKKRYTILK